jgi:hypothetical protein
MLQSTTEVGAIARLLIKLFYCTVGSYTITGLVRSFRKRSNDVILHIEQEPRNTMSYLYPPREICEIPVAYADIQDGSELLCKVKAIIIRMSMSL